MNVKVKANFVFTDDAKAALELGATMDMVIVGKLTVENGEPTLVLVNDYTIHANRGGPLYATSEPPKA